MTVTIDAATDVFSVAGSSAWDLRWSNDPWTSSPHLRARRLGPIQLARLGEVLGVGSYDTVIQGFSLLAGESQESPWVIAFPEELASAVASLGSGEVEGIGTRWANAEGMPSEISPEELKTYLEALRSLLVGHAGPFVLYVRVE
jgi:hypothetical protein